MPEYFTHPDEAAQQTREEANAWVARFAPLVMTSDVLTVPEVRERLELVEQLKEEGPRLKTKLLVASTDADRQLMSTFNRALSQLDSVETELRKSLARLAPGDPHGRPDLQVLNDKLAERQAREELGLPAESTPATLELTTSPANWAGAGSIGLFGLGWTSFTTVHAAIMIGGMWKAFGPVALAMLLFYSIFFLVGFGMLAAAFASASTETIVLEGHQLRVRRILGPWMKEKTYQLSTTMPSIERNPTGFRKEGAPPLRCIVLIDVNGKPVRLASGATESQRIQIRKQLAAYLRSHPLEQA